MPRWEPYQPEEVQIELGEAQLRLLRGRDRYPIILSGREWREGEYDAAELNYYRLQHSGHWHSLNGDLLAIASSDFGDLETERIFVGTASAVYYVEDRVLVLNTQTAPHDRPDDERTALTSLFDTFARAHYPDAAKVYRVERPHMPESVLHRLGYHLAFTVRRRPDGRLHTHPLRVWTR
jgi:hypothetical protein